MDKEDAKELYRSAQNLNAQWRRVILTYTGFAITINVGIWSYLLKAYIDSISVVGQHCGLKAYIDSFMTNGQPLYIGIAAAISSIVIGAWRFHNRQVDDDSFGLLTDLLRYELMAGVPEYSGTQGHLVKTRPKISPIFEQDNGLLLEEKLKVINKLIEKNRMGWREQRILEWVIFVIILLMLIFVSWLLFSSLSAVGLKGFIYRLLCSFGILVGLIIICIEIKYFDKEPDDNFIEKAIEEVKNDRGKTLNNTVS
jgi:hypothetical protein